MFWQTEYVVVRLNKLSCWLPIRFAGAEAAAGVEASEEVAEIVAESG